MRKETYIKRFDFSKGVILLVETEELAKNKQYKTVKLVDGYVEILDLDKIIGYCHNKIHYGAVTKNIIKTHECLLKNADTLKNMKIHHTGQG